MSAQGLEQAAAAVTGSSERVIKTPDQRLRVFVSSTLNELAPERQVAKAAIAALKLTPVLFELSARAHGPRALYRAYLDQSHIFIGIYWQNYGWIAPDMGISGIEDEFDLAAGKPKLIYIKDAGAERDPALDRLLERIKTDGSVSYKFFDEADDLENMIEDDLALLLTERFEGSLLSDTLLDSPRSNLPALVNLFVGRDREIELARKMVFEDDVRLLTLTGPGGIGKSRLALELATAFGERFSDGSHLVMLQSVQHPALVGYTIARTLDITEVAARPIQQILVDALADKKMLIVLDNFEQVLPAAGIIGELVAGCPQVAVIVTSRSPLHLRAEHEIPVPPLSLPKARDAVDADRLDRYAAVRLFVDRARAVKPEFAVTEQNAAAIIEICNRLDGVPLALELAAARTRLLSPEAMLERLKDRFALLKGGWQDLPERHRTLKATIDWSYELLDPDEKIFFRRLAIFSGGWTLDSAEQVCNPHGTMDVLELTASLVDKSLIMHVPAEGEPRFAMLETIVDYASEHLEKSDDVAETGRRHAELFLALIGALSPGLRQGDQEGTLDRLEQEADNLHCALRWLVANGRAGDAADGAWDLWTFWWLRDHLEEGTRLAGQIAAAEGLDGVQRARALGAHGGMAFWRGDYATCVPLLTEAVEIFRAAGDEEGVAICQLPLGFIGGVIAGPNDALDRFAESRAIFDRRKDLWGGVLARAAQGWMELGLGGKLVAERFEEAADMARQLGTGIELGMTYGNLGTQRLRAGRLDEAGELLTETLRLLSERHLQNLASYTMDQIAELALERGDLLRAARYFGAAHAIRERVGSMLGPCHAETRDRLIERVRAELDDQAFERARSEGAALGFKAVTAEAIEWCDRLTALRPPAA
ncbi:MAG TPA: DUF4062 domain-containing protein [Actinomycetota bacterium]|nr:DUF4062 domain-containing protein [Actinomycetota bacterium]